MKVVSNKVSKESYQKLKTVETSSQRKTKVKENWIFIFSWISKTIITQQLR